MEFTPAQQEDLLDLARGAVRTELGATLSPAETERLRQLSADPAFQQPAGCFVTLHELENHNLRGCVGRVSADRPLAEAVRDSAVHVLGDPRFRWHRVTLDDLPRLELEISVLGPLRPAPDPLAFDPLNDGIHLSLGSRVGLFLPQVARETGWSKQKLLERLCTEKMGLSADAWHDPDVQLSTFSTVTVGPEPFQKVAPLAVR